MVLDAWTRRTRASLACAASLRWTVRWRPPSSLLSETSAGARVSTNLESPCTWVATPVGPPAVSCSSARIRQRLGQLAGFRRTDVPWREAGRVFFTERTGAESQPVLYSQRAIGDTPRVVLDPADHLARREDRGV